MSYSLGVMTEFEIGYDCGINSGFGNIMWVQLKLLATYYEVNCRVLLSFTVKVISNLDCASSNWVNRAFEMSCCYWVHDCPKNLLC